MDPQEWLHFEIPRVRHLARRAVPHLLEATVLPVVVFYVALWGSGNTAAVVAALVWSYLALARRLLTGRRITGLLVLSALGMTARTAISLASGSIFVYFLQPSLGTAAVGLAFLVSVASRRPLVEKLAGDFVDIPQALLGRPAMRRVFMQISLIWATVNLLNAAGAILLLVSMPVPTYLAAKTGMTGVVTASGLALSIWWFRRSMRNDHMILRLAPAR